MTQRFTCRGVSVVIASLLLIAMAVTLSVLFYAYSARLLGSLLPPPQQGGYGNPIIESIAFTSTGAALLTVRNIGSGDSRVDAIYVDGVLEYSNPQGALIPAGQAQTFTLPGVSPTQHNFIVHTVNGGGAALYGPAIIFLVGTTTGTTTITGTSTITSSSTTITVTSTFATTYTSSYTSTFTNTGSTTTTSTWTSTNPSTYTATSQTSLTTTITSYSTSTSTWIHAKSTDTTTITSTVTTTSTSSGPTTQTFTTSTVMTGTTTQTSSITATGTTTGTTTITSTVTTTKGGFSPLWLILFIFLPWSSIRSRFIEKPSLPRRRLRKAL